MSAVLEKHLSTIRQPPTAESPPKKKAKSEAASSMPPESPASHPRESDEDEEFERRFGHLFGDGTDNDMEDNHSAIGQGCGRHR